MNREAFPIIQDLEASVAVWKMAHFGFGKSLIVVLVLDVIVDVCVFSLTSLSVDASFGTLARHGVGVNTRTKMV